MKLERLLQEMGIEKNKFADLHITRMFSAFVAISGGKVVKVTDPFLEYCPLADCLYKDIKKGDHRIRETVKRAVEEKVRKFGYFTEKRELQRQNIAIPYGASEMLMYALRKKFLDCAVVACDDAGTVIVDKPSIVQGIGARMNGLFYTTGIDEVIKKLKRYNCHVVFPKTANIDQIAGLQKAARLGYKRIAVTINAYIGEHLSKIEKLEKDHNVSVTILAVCATGINEKEIQEIEKYADLVWSCASEGIRKIGEKAILQISTKIPVFVLTEKGLNFVTNYSNVQFVKQLDVKKQYLISGRYKGKTIRMGNFNTYLSEAELPVRSRKEPRPLT